MGWLLACSLSFALGLYLAHTNHSAYRTLIAKWDLMAGVDRQYNEYDQLIRYPKNELACPRQTERTMVAVLIGQSNAANSGGQRFRGKPNVINFFQGKCFEAEDPLLGAGEKQGSVWMLTANLLANRYDNIILVPLAAGGTTVADWTGRHGSMLEKSLEQTKASGYTVTHFLWHQGESDAHLTKPADYLASLNTLITRTRRFFPESKFFVSAATYCEARGGRDEALRGAQLSAVDPARSIYPGPDTDLYTALEDRMDGCHFSGVGQEKVARAWAQTLQ